MPTISSRFGFRRAPSTTPLPSSSSFASSSSLALPPPSISTVQSSSSTSTIVRPPSSPSFNDEYCNNSGGFARVRTTAEPHSSSGSEGIVSPTAVAQVQAAQTAAIMSIVQRQPKQKSQQQKQKSDPDRAKARDSSHPHFGLSTAVVTPFALPPTSELLTEEKTESGKKGGKESVDGASRKRGASEAGYFIATGEVKGDGHFRSSHQNQHHRRQRSQPISPSSSSFGINSSTADIKRAGSSAIGRKNPSTSSTSTLASGSTSPPSPSTSNGHSFSTSATSLSPSQSQFHQRPSTGSKKTPGKRSQSGRDDIMDGYVRPERNASLPALRNNGLPHSPHFLAQPLHPSPPTSSQQFNSSRHTRNPSANRITVATHTNPTANTGATLPRFPASSNLAAGTALVSGWGDQQPHHSNATYNVPRKGSLPVEMFGSSANRVPGGMSGGGVPVTGLNLRLTEEGFPTEREEDLTRPASTRRLVGGVEKQSRPGTVAGTTPTNGSLKAGVKAPRKVKPAPSNVGSEEGMMELGGGRREGNGGAGGKDISEFGEKSVESSPTRSRSRSEPSTASMSASARSIPFFNRRERLEGVSTSSSGVVVSSRISDSTSNSASISASPSFNSTNCPSTLSSSSSIPPPILADSTKPASSFPQFDTTFALESKNRLWERRKQEENPSAPPINIRVKPPLPQENQPASLADSVVSLKRPGMGRRASSMDSVTPIGVPPSQGPASDLTKIPRAELSYLARRESSPPISRTNTTLTEALDAPKRPPLLASTSMSPFSSSTTIKAPPEFQSSPNWFKTRSPKRTRFPSPPPPLPYLDHDEVPELPSSSRSLSVHQNYEPRFHDPPFSYKNPPHPSSLPLTPSTSTSSVNSSTSTVVAGNSNTPQPLGPGLIPSHQRPQSQSLRERRKRSLPASSAMGLVDEVGPGMRISPIPPLPSDLTEDPPCSARIEKALPGIPSPARSRTISQASRSTNESITNFGTSTSLSSCTSSCPSGLGQREVQLLRVSVSDRMGDRMLTTLACDDDEGGVAIKIQTIGGGQQDDMGLKVELESCPKLVEDGTMGMEWTIKLRKDKGDGEDRTPSSCPIRISAPAQSSFFPASAPVHNSPSPVSNPSSPIYRASPSQNSKYFSPSLNRPETPRKKTSGGSPNPLILLSTKDSPRVQSPRNPTQGLAPGDTPEILQTPTSAGFGSRPRSGAALVGDTASSGSNDLDLFPKGSPSRSGTTRQRTRTRTKSGHSTADGTARESKKNTSTKRISPTTSYLALAEVYRHAHSMSVEDSDDEREDPLQRAAAPKQLQPNARVGQLSPRRNDSVEKSSGPGPDNTETLINPFAASASGPYLMPSPRSKALALSPDIRDSRTRTSAVSWDMGYYGLGPEPPSPVPNSSPATKLGTQLTINNDDCPSPTSISRAGSITSSTSSFSIPKSMKAGSYSTSTSTSTSSHQGLLERRLGDQGVTDDFKLGFDGLGLSMSSSENVLQGGGRGNGRGGGGKGGGDVDNDDDDDGNYSGSREGEGSLEGSRWSETDEGEEELEEEEVGEITPMTISTPIMGEQGR